MRLVHYFICFYQTIQENKSGRVPAMFFTVLFNQTNVDCPSARNHSNVMYRLVVSPQPSVHLCISLSASTCSHLPPSAHLPSHTHTHSHPLTPLLPAACCAHTRRLSRPRKRHRRRFGSRRNAKHACTQMRSRHRYRNTHAQHTA
jgi:hypothetical protein